MQFAELHLSTVVILSLAHLTNESVTDSVIFVSFIGLRGRIQTPTFKGPQRQEVQDDQKCLEWA